MHAYPCTHCHTEWRNAAEWFLAQYAAMYEITPEEALQDYRDSVEETHVGED